MYTVQTPYLALYGKQHRHGFLLSLFLRVWRVWLYECCLRIHKANSITAMCIFVFVHTYFDLMAPSDDDGDAENADDASCSEQANETKKNAREKSFVINLTLFVLAFAIVILSF